ncbi:MAG: KOW domain-containing RNA-binding protein [Bacillota bacterium]
MEIEPGQLVISTQGRDKGSPFVVLDIEKTPRGVFAYLVDGKKRKVHQPKKKNLKHLEATQIRNGEIGTRFREGPSVTNPEIRKIIADLMDIYQNEDQNP